jgi:hypothetical protein
MALGFKSLVGHMKLTFNQGQFLFKGGGVKRVKGDEVMVPELAHFDTLYFLGNCSSFSLAFWDTF